jgi:hypothetical protein
MSGTTPGGRLNDPQGNPSCWIALALAMMFGVAAVVGILSGLGYGAGGLVFLFVVCFNVAFNKPSTFSQAASVLGRRRK